MAALDHTGSIGPSFLTRIANGARSFLDSYIEARSRSSEFAYYASLSDSELAAKGLRREDIPMHVFRDHYL